MSGDTPVRVVFVCTGNICRSPMAEVMARQAFDEAGVGDRVEITSVGTGDWHVGNEMDPRAAAELRAHGYPTAHTAAQLSPTEHTADLLVALDSGHRDHMIREGVDPARIRLLRSYEPGASGADVADPYYGDDAGFSRTRQQISRALPGLVAEVRDLIS